MKTYKTETEIRGEKCEIRTIETEHGYQSVITSPRGTWQCATMPTKAGAVRAAIKAAREDSEF